MKKKGVFEKESKARQWDRAVQDRLNQAVRKEKKVEFLETDSGFYIPLSDALFDRAAAHLGDTDFVSSIDKSQNKLVKTAAGRDAYVSLLELVVDVPVSGHNADTVRELTVIADVLKNKYCGPRPAAISAVMKIPGALGILNEYNRRNKGSSKSVHSAINTLYGSLLGQKWSAYDFISSVDPVAYEAANELFYTGEIDPYYQAMLNRHHRSYEDLVGDIESIEQKSVFDYPAEIVAELMISWEVCPETSMEVPYVVFGH